MKGMPTTDELRQVWSIYNTTTGETVFESEDPQAIVDKAYELELEAIDEGPRPGVAASSYGISGDPFALGVLQEHDAQGNLVRGPETLRRPSGV